MASRRKGKRPRHIAPSAPQANNPEQGQLIGVSTTELSGPRPPADILPSYNELMPDAAERIIIIAKAESVHRRVLEQRAVDSQIKQAEARNRGARTGQILGFFIKIGCGTYAAVSGVEVAGGFIGAGGAVALVTVFIYGRKTA